MYPPKEVIPAMPDPPFICRATLALIRWSLKRPDIAPGREMPIMHLSRNITNHDSIIMLHCMIPSIDGFLYKHLFPPCQHNCWESLDPEDHPWLCLHILLWSGFIGFGKPVQSVCRCHFVLIWYCIFIIHYFLNWLGNADGLEITRMLPGEGGSIKLPCKGE